MKKGFVRKAVIAAGALVIASPLLALGTAGQASAATTCHGQGCTGLYAANTTCVNDAVIKETAYFHASDGSRVGSLVLYYSASCGAAWARGESNWPNGGYAYVNNTSADGGDIWPCYIPVGADMHCNTAMVNRVSPAVAWATGYVLDTAGLTHPAQTGKF